jgi:phosphoglycolate phosphatase
MSVNCVEQHQPEILGSLQRSLHPLTSRLTVFCDFDGPLIDVSDRYYQTYQLALAETQQAFAQSNLAFPLHCLSKDQFWQMKQERTADTEVALRSGLRDEQIIFFLERVRQLVNQSVLLNQDHVQPGVRWSLALLHACGVRLAVVTLRYQAEAEQILQEQGLADFFTSIRGTSDRQSAYTNYAEQKQLLLSQALAQEQYINPDTTWMIGDTEADVFAGQSLGISTIALTCGIRSHSYLSQLQPTRIHSDLVSASHYLLGLS